VNKWYTSSQVTASAGRKWEGSAAEQWPHPQNVGWVYSQLGHLPKGSIGDCQLFRLRLAHLASAAFLAISRRRSAVNFRLRALPPSCPR
jgi:hypothetical protein